VIRRFYFHRKEVDGLKDVFKFLKELIEIVSGAFALYISFSEFRGKKRLATVAFQNPTTEGVSLRQGSRVASATLFFYYTLFSGKNQM